MSIKVVLEWSQAEQYNNYLIVKNAANLPF